MNRPWYASSARQLLEDRQQGKTPDGPVIVSLIGGTFPRLTLHIRPDVAPDRFDWRMLVDLPVWIWADASVGLDWILATTSRIAAARPSTLHLRFDAADQTHDVEVGASLHMPAVLDLPAIHQFTWSPINVAATSLGGRLRKALIAQHRPGVIL